MNAEVKYKFKLPKTVGGCLTRLAVVKAEAEALAARLAPLAAEEAALREHLLQSFAKDELQGARGSGLTLSRTVTVVPVLQAWEDFWGYAKRKGNDDLVSRTVLTAPWRERLDSGVLVPGTIKFERVGLQVRREKP